MSRFLVKDKTNARRNARKWPFEKFGGGGGGGGLQRVMQTADNVSINYWCVNDCKTSVSAGETHLFNYCGDVNTEWWEYFIDLRRNKWIAERPENNYWHSIIRVPLWLSGHKVQYSNLDQFLRLLDIATKWQAWRDKLNVHFMYVWT